jgi:hypothetical protein
MPLSDSKARASMDSSHLPPQVKTVMRGLKDRDDEEDVKKADDEIELVTRDRCRGVQ